MVLDEVSLRRPDFDATGYAIELADGQKWRFPRIRSRIVPIEGDDGKVELGLRPWFADLMEEEIDILFGVKDVDDMEYVAAKVRVAVHLLKANYDLPRGAVARLLPYDGRDPKLVAIFDRIDRAILGIDPDAADEPEDSPGPNAVTPPGSP